MTKTPENLQVAAPQQSQPELEISSPPQKKINFPKHLVLRHIKWK
jgi:hypothetical protein